MSKLFYFLLSLLLVNVSAYSQNPYTWVNSVHTSLGVPFDSDTTNDYIIVRSQYVLSYNAVKGVPNWVAWQLNKNWFGDVPRYDGNFITDTSLPSGMYRVRHADYTNSNYDRGHMVRSEERTQTETDNKSTFILTNILPQTADLNRGVWLDLEYHLEDLCKTQSVDLYIYAGGVYHSDSTLLSAGKVAVPDSCFKVVFVCGAGSLVPYDTIAVMMPNIAGIRNDDWEKYETTLSRIESSIGYKLSKGTVSVDEPSQTILAQKGNNLIFDKIYEYEIYDLLGNVFTTGTADNISFGQFPVGIYFVSYSDNLNSYYFKFNNY